MARGLLPNTLPHPQTEIIFVTGIKTIPTKVKVYLYRTDTKYNTNYVSMMTVNANDQSSKVFYTRTAGSGTYKITIEAYESGGDVNGDAALAQYTSHPDLK